MVRGILKWCDKKQTEAYAEANENLPKAMAKAAGAGAVEGAIDGAAIVGLTYCALGIALTVITKIKK